LKRNVYYKKLIKHRTLFDDPIEEDEPVEQTNNEKSILADQVIERKLKITIASLDFLYGSIGFRIPIREVGHEVSFDVENIHIRPEFEVLKPYFEKFLKTKSIELAICIIIENGGIVAKSATSQDLQQLNREVVDSVRFRFAERNILMKSNLLGRGDKISQLNTSDPNTLYDSGEELLQDVLCKGSYRHKLHLQYLAEQHCGNILKLRFVISPFAFVFLIRGIEQYHIIMETLDTDEATYIWQIPKDIGSLKASLLEIDNDLLKIRNEGRAAFLESAPVNFSRVLHDYTEELKGFIVWKDDLEQCLV